MCRLGSTVARLKLKGIDGGPHKRWSMWFNSTQREEPYLGSNGWSTAVETSLPPQGGQSRGCLDDVKSSWPLCPGLHTCYNGRYKAQRTREGEPIAKNRSQFGLQAATRLHEAGIASNGRSARCREYVPGPCTHRPSHHESGLY